MITRVGTRIGLELLGGLTFSGAMLGAAFLQEIPHIGLPIPLLFVPAAGVVGVGTVNRILAGRLGVGVLLNLVLSLYLSMVVAVTIVAVLGLTLTTTLIGWFASVATALLAWHGADPLRAK